jgi:hypothetical protein
MVRRGAIPRALSRAPHAAWRAREASNAARRLARAASHRLPREPPAAGRVASAASLRPRRFGRVASAASLRPRRFGRVASAASLRPRRFGRVASAAPRSGSAALPLRRGKKQPTPRLTRRRCRAKRFHPDRSIRKNKDLLFGFFLLFPNRDCYVVTASCSVARSSSAPPVAGSMKSNAPSTAKTVAGRSSSRSQPAPLPVVEPL